MKTSSSCCTSPIALLSCALLTMHATDTAAFTVSSRTGSVTFKQRTMQQQQPPRHNSPSCSVFNPTSTPSSTHMMMMTVTDVSSLLSDHASNIILGVELALVGATIPLYQTALESSQRRKEEEEAERKVSAELKLQHQQAEELRLQRKKAKEAEREERRKKIEASIQAAREEEERIRKNKEEAIRLAEEKALAAKKAAADAEAAEKQSEVATKTKTGSSKSSAGPSSKLKP